jgi:hypothetical protein
MSNVNFSVSQATGSLAVCVPRCCLDVEKSREIRSSTLSVSEESSRGVPFSKSEKFGVVEVIDAPDSSVWVPSSKNKFPGLLEVSVMIG